MNNRFRVNLHPAFFKRHEVPGDKPDSQSEKEKKKKTKEQQLAAERDGEKESVLGQARIEEEILKDSIRRNNEALSTASVTIETQEEKEQSDEDVTKELEKQLKQLAKNKKIDFPWTDNAWKCSRTEKRLAIGSARVFQQLLEQGKLQAMIEKCKSQNGDLSKETAADWGKELGINSKSKDIVKFYKSYKEYQNPQSDYQHLKNLMGFFCENEFENTDNLRENMKNRSQKISKKDIRTQRAELYEEGWEKDGNGNERYVIRDKKTGEEIKHKPKDWKERAKFEVIRNRLNDGGVTTDKMLTLLGDYNLDGEVNSGDVGSKTGSQVADVFRRTVATNALENKNFDADTAVQNLVKYANKFGLDIPADITSVNHLYRWMTNHDKGYENTTKLQNFIRNLPIELGDVLTNGENAGKESLDHISSALNIEAAERESAEKAAAEKAQEFVDKYDSLLKDRIKDATKRANITQQLLSQLPGVLMNEARNMQKGLGVGVAIPLNELVRGLSLGLNVGIDKDGTPRAGIYGGWDHNFNLGKGFDVSTGASAGLNSFFIPCESLFVELGYDVSEKKRKNTLDATGINRVSLGANCTMYGPIFSWGVSAGYEHNKQGGIEKQAKSINGQIKTKAIDLIDAVKNKAEGQSEEDSLELKLKELFPKSSEEELKNATNNMLQIISQFKIDDKTTEKDRDIYAQIVADVYTEMWRNEAISGIADNKRKLSGGKVGIQFLAGFFPAVTLVAKFTKYYNARTNETEHSKTARIDAQVNGTGNKLIALEGKEVGNDKVNQINEILKRYGAKSSLEYIEGKGGKPGKIQVPASIADEIGINIRVSESLKGCVDQLMEKRPGGETFYQFPANATYRLLQETGGNQRSVTLNIGSDKSSTSDILLADSEKMGELVGDKELVAGKKLEYNTNFVGKGSVEYKPDFIDSLFTADVVEGLKTIDSSDRRKFSAFMRTKTDAKKTFDEMLQSITDVLGKDKKYEAIIGKLSDSDTSNEDKQLIIDRIMAISVDTNVHDARGLSDNVKIRKDYYKKETMTGPNGQSIFDKLEVNRDDFIKELNDYSVQSMPNILGATAFYHRNNTAKGLALTGLGATNVLGGKTQELTGDDMTKVRNWFLGNSEGESYVPGVLEKSPVEFNNIKRAVESRLGLSGLSEDNVKSLLKGEEIEFALDNSNKKAKVKLDVKYVFYLMGECANESVGMELGNIQVQEQHEVDDYRQGELYLNNGDGSNSVNVSRRDFAAGITLGGGNKGGKNEGDNNGKVKTEGEYEDTGELPSTHPQVNGQDDTKIGEIPVGQGENSGNELGEL